MMISNRGQITASQSTADRTECYSYKPPERTRISLIEPPRKTISSTVARNSTGTMATLVTRNSTVPDQKSCRYSRTISTVYGKGVASSFYKWYRKSVQKTPSTRSSEFLHFFSLWWRSWHDLNSKDDFNIPKVDFGCRLTVQLSMLNPFIL